MLLSATVVSSEGQRLYRWLLDLLYRSFPSMFRIRVRPHQVNVGIFLPNWPSSNQPSIGLFQTAASNCCLEPSISWSLFEHGLESASLLVGNGCWSVEWLGIVFQVVFTLCSVHDVKLGPTLSSPSHQLNFECFSKAFTQAPHWAPI